MVGITIFLHLLSQDSFFRNTNLTNEKNIIKSISPVVVQAQHDNAHQSSLRWPSGSSVMSLYFTSVWTSAFRGYSLQTASQHFRKVSTSRTSHYATKSNMFETSSHFFLFILLISILIFPRTVHCIPINAENVTTIIYVQHIPKITWIYPNW